MASINGNQVLADLKKVRERTKQNSGTIKQNGKVLASVYGAKPVKGKAEPQPKLTPKQSFLKQIEAYNDFIVQNDLDAEKVDPSYDYDFSAFNPKSWQVEGQRLKDRLADRQEEVNQIATDGEFSGKSLEGKMPSYEATQNMSDEEYAAYEKKYLLPSPGEFKKAPVPTPKSAPSEVIIPGSIEGKQIAHPSKPNFIKTSKVASPELIALRAKNKADNERPDNGGIVVPADVGSRVNDKGTLNFVRDFAVDGLGSFFRSRDEGRDKRYLPRDLYIANQKRLHRKKINDAKAKEQKLAEVQKIQQREPKPSTPTVPFKDRFKMDRNNIVLNSLPLPLKQTVDSGLDAVRSGSKVVDQTNEYGLPKTLRDAGRGVTAGLYDSADTITSLGGLAKNRVSRLADNIANNIRTTNEIPNSEVERLGELTSEGAVGGVVGGLLGRGLGTVYKDMRRGGEMLKHSATRTANNRQKLVDDHIDYGHKFLNKIGMPSNIRKGKISAKDALMTRQNTYENLTNKLPRKPLNSGESLGSVLSHNIKRNFDNRAMLQRNDTEINTLFNQGHSLKQARQMQKDQWDQLPGQGVQLGGVLGIAVNGRNSNNNASSLSTGVGGMKNNGRVKVSSGI